MATWTPPRSTAGFRSRNRARWRLMRQSRLIAGRELTVTRYDFADRIEVGRDNVLYLTGDGPRTIRQRHARKRRTAARA